MKTCPKCSKQYEFNMSFCLDDGSPLQIDNEAQTIEKLENTEFPQTNTSPNEPRATSQQAQVVSSGIASPPPAKRSYLGIIVGIFALGSFLMITLGIAGGIWWYMANQPARDSGPSTQTNRVDSPDSEKTPPAKKTGAVTMENYKKIKTGMSYKEVVEIFGEEGEEMSSTDIAGYKTETYMWKSGTFTNVTLTFQNEKLMSKFQMGLD